MKENDRLFSQFFIVAIAYLFVSFRNKYCCFHFVFNLIQNSIKLRSRCAI